MTRASVRDNATSAFTGGRRRARGSSVMAAVAAGERANQPAGLSHTSV